MPRKNRRRLRNYLLRPRVQLGYGLHYFICACAMVFAVQVYSFFSVRAVINRILRAAGAESSALQPVIDLALRDSMVRSAWLLPAVGLVFVVLTTVILNRFVGPIVPLRRHVDRLADGKYGVECVTRRTDELHDLVSSVNALSQRLKSRHGDSWATEPAEPEEVEAPEKRRQAGFSIIELLVVLAAIMIISAIAVAQFITAYDRARQRGSLADMRAIAAANGAHFVDNSDYGATLNNLVPYYIGTLPPVDRWGYAWTYSLSSGDYTLTSLGADGSAGPAAPAGWKGDPFECDLILWNGSFTQAPDTS